MNRAMLVLLVGLAAPELCEGQSSNHSAEPDGPQLSELQDRVSGRQQVRISTSTDRCEVFHDPTLASPGTLHFAQPSGWRDSLSLSKISEIHARGSAAGTGAIVGAAFGGLLGLVGGIALAADSWLGVGPAGVLAVTALGAAMGTLPGALIGAAFRKWKTVYRAEPRRVAFAVVPDSRGRLAVAASIRF